jgi:NAD(P)H-flavin reductase/Pyruvate/2-oxoacid:ferredoxin oxidoreductase delta subunit
VVNVAAPAEAYFLPRADLYRLLDVLRLEGHRLVGPKVVDGAIVFDEVHQPEDLPAGWGAETAPGRNQLVRRDDDRLFDYPPGPTSPKTWLFPPRVQQRAWNGSSADGGATPNEPKDGRVALLGLRACEIAAIEVQDRVLLGGPVTDPDYRSRREGALIVAIECAVAGSTCFCSSMATGPEITTGFDLALSELDEGFVVRVGSDQGASLAAGLLLAQPTADQLARAAASVGRVREQMGTPLPMDGAGAKLMAAPDHPRWADVADRCLACANCVLVCPTCFCTSVSQRSELDGQGATTDRVWDSCFTLDFARVAGGNFRTRREDRYRQWLTHKFGTWWEQFGSTGCVGCGRCISWCPVGIDVREEVMAIAGPAMAGPAIAGPATADSRPLISAFKPLNPAAAPAARPVEFITSPPSTDAAVAAATVEPATELPWVETRVMSTTRETADVVTLRLATDDPRILAGRPGQFVMAALPALAAPPISISRFHDDSIELTIRGAGPATAAICNLERGDSLSLRGPLGRGWPVEMAEGRDVMIVTGGIGLAPLRPLIDELLARRERFGSIHLAYGARTPADRLYVDELQALAGRRDFDFKETVDRAGPEWLGRVGVVTQVIDRAMCSCDRTVAFVCGPERMMEATADVLRLRDVPDERIFVTLERHMDCGVGLCGHCQLGKFFVCRDGPVFSLAELGPSFRQEGL